MTFLEELSAAEMLAVLADDRLIESLRTGLTPTGSSPLVTLLARWRDMCAAGV